MRRPPRRKPRPSTKKRFISNQNLIILLLTVLIIITGANLYFNHLTGDSTQKAVSSSVSSTEKLKTAPPKTTTDSVKSAMALPATLTKPDLIPPISSDMPPPNQIHIQLLNGCGIPGLASRARLSLRKKGFDILTFGNAQAQDYTQTVIIARSPSPKGELAAKRVANALGVTVDQIQIKEDPNLVDTDVTLILGADHTKLNLSTE